MQVPGTSSSLAAFRLGAASTARDIQSPLRRLWDASVGRRDVLAEVRAPSSGLHDAITAARAVRAGLDELDGIGTASLARTWQMRVEEPLVAALGAPGINSSRLERLLQTARDTSEIMARTVAGDDAVVASTYALASLLRRDVDVTFHARPATDIQHEHAAVAAATGAEGARLLDEATSNAPAPNGYRALRDAWNKSVTVPLADVVRLPNGDATTQRLRRSLDDLIDGLRDPMLARSTQPA